MISKRMGRIFAIIIVMLAGVTAAAAAEVRTRSGVVAGSAEDGVAVYKGVPFAAPPVGQNRWRDPMPVAPWKGVKQTTAFGPGCPQQARTSMNFGARPETFAEDCLYLNIWTPAASPGAKLPVMVWLYGGGFTTGSAGAPVYSGQRLAKKGVIVVTINYRLGPLGFLAHPALTAESGEGRSGNYGVLDQIAALKWVRDNIAPFGGDPQKVTVFGESAGGVSASVLAASPRAKGLFQRLISESGPAFSTQGPVKDKTGPSALADAEKFGEGFFAQLGVSTLEQARALPVDKIVAAAPPQAAGPYWPTRDGVVIVGDPFDIYRRGAFNDTPILIGSNSDEGAMFSPTKTAADHVALVRGNYGDFADRFLQAYPAASDKEAVRSGRDLIRDTAMGWSNWSWARLAAEHGRKPVYVYYFDHRPPWPDTPPVFDWGATHGSEISYVFGNLDPGFMKWTAKDREVSETMMTYWTNFAKTGDPNGGGLPAWPRFTVGRPSAMVFADTPTPGPLPNRDRMELIDDYAKHLAASGK
jgi:para-nitrobenzyl esterase